MEKGSMLTAIEHGSVGPKRMAKAISESKAVLTKLNGLVSNDVLCISTMRVAGCKRFGIRNQPIYTVEKQ